MPTKAAQSFSSSSMKSPSAKAFNGSRPDYAGKMSAATVSKIPHSKLADDLDNMMQTDSVGSDMWFTTLRAAADKLGVKWNSAPATEIIKRLRAANQ